MLTELAAWYGAGVHTKTITARVAVARDLTGFIWSIALYAELKQGLDMCDLAQAS